MKTFIHHTANALRFTAAVYLAALAPVVAADYQVLGWNNLGMHCMDSDYSVFSILPPYNTIQAQLIVGGHLVTASNSYSVTYQAVADPDGSFNSTAIGKGNFYQFDSLIYGVDLPPDMGLAGWALPGVSNIPQTMLFEQTNEPAPGVLTLVNWFRAEGIPLSPYDNAYHKNPYPLMRLIARNGTMPIATNDIVLPVSDEMDCRACHASGSYTNSMPRAGWVWSANPERDYRLNILRLHDERMNPATWPEMLSSNGFDPQGLYRTVVADGKPILCAKCHLSEALPGTGVAGVPPLTESVHAYHAHVLDPVSNVTLNDSVNRSACYRCHPGSTTKCLRGAMGGAIGTDGSMEMQCQSCHGHISQVGDASRVGWFMEPNCQSCHVGTADHTATIRYTSVFTDTNGTVRTPADQTFATQPNIPAADLSLFRFSAGHGGLQCSACHGSTHAEFPSTHRNDNIRNEEIQGHAGVMVECAACHVGSVVTVSGGPHGMHPVGQPWVGAHGEAADGHASQCRACHGMDYRGTVLSRMQADRTLSAFGTKTFFRGAIIGCYTCHNGPGSETGNNSTPPSVANVSTNTTNDSSVAMTLPVTGSGAALRIVSQPANGSVGLSGNTATYFPNPGFVGTDTFTFAAYDGAKNSSLATGSVTVTQGQFSIGATTHVPPAYPAGWPVAFTVLPVVTNHAGPGNIDWDFGDGSVPGTNQYEAHVYAQPGSYSWSVVCSVSTASVTNSGTLQINGPMAVKSTVSGGLLTLSWPSSLADTVLEKSPALGPQAQWTPVTNSLVSGVNSVEVNLDVSAGTELFRLRQVQ